MTEHAFRKMEKGDVARVAELERLCFRSPWSEGALRSELCNPLAHYELLIEDALVQGYAGMWVFMGEAHITNVAIAPDRRGMGLGRSLMLHMMGMARALGAVAMTLEVRETNTVAQRLYFSLGFEKAGARKHYYADTGEAAWILWNYDLAASLLAQAAPKN